VLLDEAVAAFLDYLDIELSRSSATLKGYRKDLKVFADFLKNTGRGNIPLKEMTPELLGAYLRHLSKERGNQANTVRRRVTALKSFCSFLTENGYLQRNPAENLPRPRSPQKYPRYLQKEEIEKLLSAIEEDGSQTRLRDKTALMLLYYTGVRVGELVNLRRRELDLTSGFITIARSKGGRFRRIPLHPRLKSQLEKYLQDAPEPPGEYLFVNRAGQPLSTDYIHHIIGEYAQKALGKKVSPHMLRHSFATHLYREEVDLAALGKLLGHAGLRTTAVYTHTDIKHLREAVNSLNTPHRLEELLFGKEQDDGET